MGLVKRISAVTAVMCMIVSAGYYGYAKESLFIGRQIQKAQTYGAPSLKGPNAYGGANTELGFSLGDVTADNATMNSSLKLTPGLESVKKDLVGHMQNIYYTKAQRQSEKFQKYKDHYNARTRWAIYHTGRSLSRMNNYQLQRGEKVQGTNCYVVRAVHSKFKYDKDASEKFKSKQNWLKRAGTVVGIGQTDGARTTMFLFDGSIVHQNNNAQLKNGVRVNRADKDFLKAELKKVMDFKKDLKKKQSSSGFTKAIAGFFKSLWSGVKKIVSLIFGGGDGSGAPESSSSVNKNSKINTAANTAVDKNSANTAARSVTKNQEGVYTQ